MKIGQNFKWAFTDKTVLKCYAIAAGAAVGYTVLPTVFNTDGWTGVAIGAGIPFLIGVFTKNPMWLIAAAAIFATHMIYTHGNDTVKKVTGKNVWAFSKNPVRPVEAAGGYTPDMADQVMLPTGEVVDASRPSDYAYSAPQLPQGVSDYVTRRAMGDYVNRPTMADSFVPGGTARF